MRSALNEAIARWIAADHDGQPEDADHPESHAASVARVDDVVRELTEAPGTSLAVTSAA